MPRQSMILIFFPPSGILLLPLITNSMGLPSKRRTNRSKRERASHFALKKVPTGKCTKCGAPASPHRACAVCGTYRGRQAVNVEKRTNRRIKRLKTVR